MATKLTWKEAYRAAYGFLDGIWDGVTGEDQKLLAELDTFLGGMMPQEDGSSTDPTMMELWHEAAARITHGGGWGDLTEEEAYRAMVLFLVLWARDNSDGTISGICEDLSRTGPEREGWREAVQKIKDGEFDFYFGLVEKEDHPREVRATLVYLESGGVLLTKRPYCHWREVEAEYTDCVANLPALTYEELTDFFANDFKKEENWPFSKDDLWKFFEGDEETICSTRY